MITVKHYVSDIRNNIEIQYDGYGLCIQIPLETLDEAKEFRDKLDKAIEDWEL